MYFIDSPIIVSNTASGFSNEATMKQLNFLVTCNGKEHVFSAEAKNGEVIRMDISSALRSSMFQIRQHNESAIPSSSFTVKAYISEYLNGELIEGSKQQIMSDTATFGHLTEMEQAAGVSASGLSRTTKPKNGERYPAGHVIVSSNGTSYTRITAQTATSELPMVEFLFVNQRGAIEDAVCVTRQALSYDHKQRNRYSNVGMPSASPAVSIRNTRTKVRPKWKLSSGYVSRDWAEWYAAELLASDQVWINVGTPSSPNWQACVLTPDESVSIFDESNPDALHIDFTCELAREGRV